jgi:hypothetical protein
MSRRRQSARSSSCGRRPQPPAQAPTPKAQLSELLSWVLPEGAVFRKDEFHGNTRWSPEQLAVQALLWSWQETPHVTDAFTHATEVCSALGWKKVAASYTSFMNALDRYAGLFITRVRKRCQMLATAVGGRFFRTGPWVLMGLDGSRTTAPRTVSNERAFCAPRYGHGRRAKHGPKKSKGMRRRRNKKHPPHPPAPQAWVTMMWHMRLRLPWTWRLGPSNSSERDHAMEMLAEEEFPENTLFCGDAGFIGYRLWSAITQAGHDFVVRVGANVQLLCQHADVKRLGGGIVLCWPKGKMQSGEPPLRLRLVRVKVGATKMWLLTSVIDRARLSQKQLARIYRMRWGIEVEFRGLKQTLDKHKLRCRNSDRLLVELDWSLCGMAIAELLALQAQLSATRQARKERDYNPNDRSLANTMRALRQCMRSLSPRVLLTTLVEQLSGAQVQRYRARTKKQARYRPKNPDKKPLGDPVVRKLNAYERKKLHQHHPRLAA